MEPTDLNSPPNAHDDARLEAMLRRVTPALPDDGFSARMLAALPPAVESSGSRYRAAFCVGGALVGLGFALWRGVSLPDLKFGFSQIQALTVNSFSIFADPLFIAALGLTLLSLLVAFQAQLRDRLLS